MEYKIKSVASAVQWITGMGLLAKDPGGLLTAAHPNTGAIFCYPGHKAFDGQGLQESFHRPASPKALKSSVIKDLDRIQLMRSPSQGCPCQNIGLEGKGTLAPAETWPYTILETSATEMHLQLRSAAAPSAFRPGS